MNIIDLRESFYAKLPSDKIKINWNARPIKMNQFLSFLTVKVERSRDHLGSTNGWTRLENKELQLIICGGIVGNTEFLDSIQFGQNLDNRFNNYVNPFYMFSILTKEGRAFFLDYYKDDIEKLLITRREQIAFAENSLAKSKHVLANIENEIESLKSDCK
jgi:hypothetical protein